jgi:hypothetical protein
MKKSREIPLSRDNAALRIKSPPSRHYSNGCDCIAVFPAKTFVATTSAIPKIPRDVRIVHPVQVRVKPSNAYYIVRTLPGVVVAFKTIKRDVGTGMS